MSDKKIIFVLTSFPVSTSSIIDLRERLDATKNIVVLVSEKPHNKTTEYYMKKEPGIYIHQI